MFLRTISMPAPLIDDWTIVDEGTNEGPSDWKVSSGILVQAANIYGGQSGGTEPFEPETYLLNGELSWKDYTVTLGPSPKRSTGF